MIQSNLLPILAHSGEAHGSTVSATAHALAWYVQLPLFALAVAMVMATVWLLTKKIDTALLVTSFGMLIASFGLFQIAPLVSVLAITFGLVITLAVTLLGLGAAQQN